MAPHFSTSFLVVFATIPHRLEFAFKNAKIKVCEAHQPYPHHFYTLKKCKSFLREAQKEYHTQPDATFCITKMQKSPAIGVLYAKHIKTKLAPGSQVSVRITHSRAKLQNFTATSPRYAFSAPTAAFSSKTGCIATNRPKFALRIPF